MLTVIISRKLIS